MFEKSYLEIYSIRFRDGFEPRVKDYDKTQGRPAGTKMRVTMISFLFLSWSENFLALIGGYGQINTFRYFIGQQR